jgi:hypothetical protein
VTNESEALKVIRDAIVQSELEWDQEEQSAVVLAIVCGWHEALPEVAEKFGWSEDVLDSVSTQFIGCFNPFAFQQRFSSGSDRPSLAENFARPLSAAHGLSHFSK